MQVFKDFSNQNITNINSLTDGKYLKKKSFDLRLSEICLTDF